MKKEVEDHEGRGNGGGCSPQSFVLRPLSLLKAGIVREVLEEGFSRISTSSPRVPLQGRGQL